MCKYTENIYCFLPHFHGPLNMENDNADGASVYFGHILVDTNFISKNIKQPHMASWWKSVSKDYFLSSQYIVYIFLVDNL